MISIHYVDGPESLRDMSVEVSKQIEDLLTGNCYTDQEIMLQYSISSEALDAIKLIRHSKLKRCCFCGALFDPKGHSRKAKCDKEVHFLPCIDCGVPVKVSESYVNYMKAGGRRCSACRSKQISASRRNKTEEEKATIISKQQATMIERYGAATPLQCAELKAKIQQTVKERYGVDNLSQSPEIQAKIKQHSQEKYGVDHYSNAPEIRARMRQGMLDKYGVLVPLQNESLKEKMKQTNLERYGCENVFQNKEVRDTFTKRHMTKYGVAWPHQRPDLIEQVKQSCIEKYGAPMYPVSDSYMMNVIADPSKFENYKAFMTDPESFIKSHYIDKPSAAQLCEDTGVTDTTIYDKLISIGRRDLATEAAFAMETQVIEFIHSLDANIRIEKHDRKILEKKEIDILLPEFDLGIECNPTYTHNSSFRDPWNEPPKHYKYHADKSILAQKNGIFLYHIFGYEWTNRRDVIQSQLQNLLGKNKVRLFARNTTVVEVSPQVAADFLNANHRQGTAQSSIRLGLVNSKSDELVSLMTFGKMRPGIGKKAGQSDNECELVRFCNLKGVSVVGGASKLFSYFIKEYNPDKVVSFSDMAHTRGTLYDTLRFNQVSISDPGYVWVNLHTDRYYTRVTCQKQNLPKLFSDVTLDDINTHSEREIMMQHDYAQVFDSGVIRWEWTPESSKK